MKTDTFFNTLFKQFSPSSEGFSSFKESDQTPNEVNTDPEYSLIKCHGCKKGIIYHKSNLFMCPICKGHGKLIINVTDGKHYNLGEIIDIHLLGDIK